MQTINEFIEEMCDEDPSFRDGLDRAQNELKGIKSRLGDKAYNDWLLSHIEIVDL